MNLHGMPAGVDARCGCQRCRRCATRVRVAYADTTRGVPVFRAVRRVRALVAIGWTLPEIAAAAGLPLHEVQMFSAARHLRNGCPRRTFARLAAAYEPMSAAYLTGPMRDTFRVWARGRKCWPPLAWENIDAHDDVARVRPHDLPDGTTVPRLGHAHKLDEVVVLRVLEGDWRIPTNAAEKREVVRRWMADGRALLDLERLTGWNTDRYTPDAPEADDDEETAA